MCIIVFVVVLVLAINSLPYPAANDSLVWKNFLSVDKKLKKFKFLEFGMTKVLELGTKTTKKK
jgi:uncharacterized membrane protein YciS (DUF1049 family)